MTSERILKIIGKKLKSEIDQKIPLKVLKQVISDEFEGKDIDEIIDEGLIAFQFNLVFDYPHDRWNMPKYTPIWHLKLFSPEEEQQLRNLSSVDLSIIRIIQMKRSDEMLGMMKVTEVITELAKMGYNTEDKVRISVPNFIKKHYEYNGDELTKWCYLIPEYEKTEEYKRAEEEMNREADERAARKAFYADAFDLADAICGILQEHKDGFSKEEISKRLSWYYPKALERAFAINLEDGNIELVKLPNGTEVYRIVASELD